MLNMTGHKENLKLMNYCPQNNTVIIFMKQKIQKVQTDIDKKPSKNTRLQDIIYNKSQIKQIKTKETGYLTQSTR